MAALGRYLKDAQVRKEIAVVDRSLFQGDMMQISRVGVSVVRNVKEAVNTRRLQVKHPRSERVVMSKARKRDETGENRAGYSSRCLAISVIAAREGYIRCRVLRISPQKL